MADHPTTPNPVQTLQEEAVCAICLDYFTDPVSIGCGHNFCRGCVTQLWGKEDEDRDEEEGEWGEDDGGQAVGAIGGWDSSVREVLYQESADELSQDPEEDEPWVGDSGIRNWDHVDYVWDPEEEEEDGDYYLEDLEIDIYEEEEVLEEYEEEEERYPDTHQPPPPAPPAPPAPPRQFTCPQCRKSFTSRSFRPNLQLANMVQVIRHMCPTPYSASLGDDTGICSKHQKALKLFCEVDNEAICVVCLESRSHQQHSVVPLEEVAQEYAVRG